MFRLIMAVLWPSFLVAIAAEGVFFSMIDPHELALGGGHLEWTPRAVYTVGFFFFWLIGAVAGFLSCYLFCWPERRRDQAGR